MAPTAIRELRFSLLQIPFRTAFRHASAERSETSSVWVEAVGSDGAIGRGESCPRPYVTGETTATAREFFARHESTLRDRVHDLESLRQWTAVQRAEIDRHPAAWCAVELAILDLLATAAGCTIEQFLGVPALSGRMRYTAVLGDMPIEAFRTTAGKYRHLGFSDFKVKLSGRIDDDRAKMAVLREWADARVRVDANNLWGQAADAIAFLQALDAPLFAVEEPIGSGQYEQLAGVAERLGCRVVLDESCARAEQVPALPGGPDLWLINLRVSKMGGLLRSLDVAQMARVSRIGLIVGAQVGETSLLTRAALTVAHASRDILVAQEGAFGTLLIERDVCDPPLMFGQGGVLDVNAYPALRRPGLGIVPSVGFTELRHTEAERHQET